MPRRHISLIIIYNQNRYCTFLSQSVSSSSVVFAEKRFPCNQPPLPAKAQSESSLSPISLEPDVQKGMTLIPLKSCLSTKVLMTLGA